MLSVPLEGTGICPCLDDEVMCLIKTFTAGTRIHGERVILRADASDESANDSSTGDYVKVGNLFCNLEGMVAE